jgi:hypothetical protein
VAVCACFWVRPSRAPAAAGLGDRFCPATDSLGAIELPTRALRFGPLQRTRTEEAFGPKRGSEADNPVLGPNGARLGEARPLPVY